MFGRVLHNTDQIGRAGLTFFIDHYVFWKSKFIYIIIIIKFVNSSRASLFLSLRLADSLIATV